MEIRIGLLCLEVVAKQAMKKCAKRAVQKNICFIEHFYSSLNHICYELTSPR